MSEFHTTDDLDTTKKPENDMGDKELTTAAPTPMALMESAIAKGVDPDMLEKLMDLQERYEANQSKQAFNVAMAKFQSECPPIERKKTVPNKDGSVRYRFAPLEDIMKTIRPLMDKYGLSIRYSTSDTDGFMTVIAKVSHIEGHCEESSFTCPTVSIPAANSAQNAGGTNSFTKRYATANALDLVLEDEDTDANYEDDSVPAEMATDEQLIQLQDYAEAKEIPETTLEWIEKRKWKLTEAQAAEIIKRLAA